MPPIPGDSAEQSDEVQNFMEQLTHARESELEALRAIVRSAHPGLTEHIKWNAPSFCFQGNDRLTFNLSAKSAVRLVFHRGAKKRTTAQTGRLIEDPAGLLQWASDDRAIATFTSLDEVITQEPALRDLVTRWVTASTDSPS